MAKQATHTVIQNAIDDSTAYASGERKNRLRAAFDIVAAEEYGRIFGSENISLLNMRQTLNACKKSQFSAPQWKIIEALREAVKQAETSLHASDYSDHTADIEDFINGPLKRFYKALR